MELEQLTQIAELEAAATDRQITEAQNEVGIKFPEEHRTLLQYSNGLFINDLIKIYSTEEIAERNRTFEVEQYLPGFIMIGDDSGGSGIFLNTKDVPSLVYKIGHGSLAVSDAIILAQSLTDWIDQGCTVPDE